MPRRRRLRRPGAAGVQAALTEAMVDRLMWRTGFGPSTADRRRLRGRSLHRAVDDLLGRPQGRLTGAAPLRNGAALDPHEDDRDLVLSWVDRMVRTQNPLVERMTFFWHRHFATQRSEVSPPQLMTRQNELFRRYSDFSAFPTANYRALVHEVGEDPAMLRFLNGEQSTARRVNENYPREVMELFCLGPTLPDGTPNYSETDVAELSRALTGWRIDDSDPDAPRSYFQADRFDDGPKTILGRTGAFGHRDAVDVVLAHPAHPQFLVTKLWSEFHPGPPSRGTLADLVRTYRRARFRIRPVLRKVLTHPAMLDSIREPNMIKPPVVYAVGIMRALRLPVVDDTLFRQLGTMGQQPYFPPTVAGWEGGLAWLNTNTALERFATADRLLRLAYRYRNLPDGRPEDVEDETVAQAFARAHAFVGRPWMAPKTRSALLYYARNAPAGRARDRIQRQTVLRAFMLGGPDAQVM